MYGSCMPSRPHTRLMIFVYVRTHGLDINHGSELYPFIVYCVLFSAV